MVVAAEDHIDNIRRLILRCHVFILWQPHMIDSYKQITILLLLEGFGELLQRLIIVLVFQLGAIYVRGKLVEPLLFSEAHEADLEPLIFQYLPFFDAGNRTHVAILLEEV